MSKLNKINKKWNLFEKNKIRTDFTNVYEN